MWLILFLIPLSANSTIITFDNQSAQFGYSGTKVEEGDYLFSNDIDGFGANNKNHWPSNGTMHLMSWVNGGNTSGFSVTNTVSNVFDVQSFDFAGGYIDGRSPVSSLEVFGWLGNNLINSYTFNANLDFLNSSTYSTLNTVFMGIDRLQVVASGANNRAQFDDFVFGPLTEVPEPTSIFLFGFGLIGVLSSLKRKAV